MKRVPPPVPKSASHRGVASRLLSRRSRAFDDSSHSNETTYLAIGTNYATKSPEVSLNIKTETFQLNFLLRMRK